MQTQKHDRLATASLSIGGIGLVLTGLSHSRSMLITQLNSAGSNLEYFILLGAAFLLLVLASLELDAGFSAMRQTPKSAYRVYSKMTAVSEIMVGVVELLPVILCLVIVIEVFLLRFLTLKPLFEF